MKIGTKEVRETIQGTIANADLVETKNGHNELRFRVTADGIDHALYPRYSLSKTVCTKGKNQGKSIAQVSVESVRRDLGMPKASPIEALNAREGYIGRPVTIHLADSDQVNPETGEAYDDIVAFNVGGAGGTVSADEALAGLQLV